MFCKELKATTIKDYYNGLDFTKVTKKYGIEKSATLYFKIKVIRNKFKDCGYRIVTIELKRRGYNINHKKVLRIMKNERLLCDSYKRNLSKYNSYKGTCDKVASNRLRKKSTTLKDSYRRY